MGKKTYRFCKPTFTKGKPLYIKKTRLHKNP